MLIALALAGLAPHDRDFLDSALGRELSVEEITELQRLIRSSGADNQVETMITDLTDRALAALDSADIRDEARTALRALAAAATQRGF